MVNNFMLKFFDLSILEILKVLCMFIRILVFLVLFFHGIVIINFQVSHSFNSELECKNIIDFSVI